MAARGLRWDVVTWKPGKEHNNIAASTSEGSSVIGGASDFPGPVRNGMVHGGHCKHGGEPAACLKECCILQDKRQYIFVW